MSDLFYAYLASGVLFLIIEMFSATFYGLSVSIACFILALYVYVTGDASINVLQWFLLACISGVFAYAFPRLMKTKAKDLKSGLSAHIGGIFRLEKVGSDWKVKIDWVDYLIDDDCVTESFEAGKKVHLESYNSTILTVSLIQ